MSVNLQPPPTFQAPTIVDSLTQEETFAPIWLKWFIDNNQNLADSVNALEDSTGASVATTYKVLIPAKAAEGADTKQYTAQNCTAIIDRFTGTNVTGGAITLTVNLVTISTASDVTNRIFSVHSIAANATYEFPALVGHVIEAGGFISTTASSAASIVIRCSGRELS